MTELQIKGYEIIRKLGHGGMAQVFLARELVLQREVAIKVLPFHLLEREDSQKRFEREAKTIAKLDHRAIVAVYGYGEGNLGPYLAMRYMRGGSLSDKLGQGILSLAEAVHILDRIADGLDKAHKAGVVHRDIKPANILFDEDGEAYLADFGIVKLANPDFSITGSDAFVGTPAYMSPESFRDVEVDGRTDIYALGVMLYQMLTGLLPYSALTPLRLIEQHVSGALPSVRDVVPTLPELCDKVIQKAMAKDPNGRYQTARAMVDELKQAIFVPDETRPYERRDEAAGDEIIEAEVSGNNVEDELDDGDKGKRPIVWIGLVAIMVLLLGWVIFFGLDSLREGIVTPTTAVTQPVLIAEETNTLVPTETIMTATGAPTETVGEVATETSLPPTATAVPIASPTAIPDETATPVIVKLETTTTNVNLYGGPSTENPVMGLLVSGVVVEAIGKVNNGSWYEVRTEAGKVGWVEAEKVAFVSGIETAVSITWPRSTANNDSLTPVASGGTSTADCTGVSVTRNDFGERHILWNSYPETTDHLWLSISGADSGDPLIYPNVIDQNDPDWAENGFTIGSWLYGQRGFPENTTYLYLLKAIDASGTEICAVSGNFVE